MPRHFVAQTIFFYASVALVCVLTFVMMGGYRFIIAGGDFSDSSVHDSQTPMQMIFIYGSFIFGIILILIRIFRAGTIAARVWPLYIPALLALVSAIWSVDPQVTLLRSAIWLAICAYCIGIITFLGPTVTIRMYAATGIAIIFLSVATVFLVPVIGVHQITDASQSTHAGSWRGVFSHRTQLGQFCAMFIVICTAYRKMLWRLPVTLAIGLGLVCMVQAASTGAFLTLAVGLMSFMIVRVIANRGIKTQTLFIFFALLLFALFGEAKSSIEEPLLQMLGKSSTLTGRTDLWDKLHLLAVGHDMRGFGYSAGIKYFLSTSPDLIDVPNAQSAYLDMWIAFGMVGTGIVIVSWGLLCIRLMHFINQARVLGNLRLARIDDGLSLSIAMIMMIAQMAIGESFFMETNNFLWPTIGLLIPAAASMALDTAPTSILWSARARLAARRAAQKAIEN